MFVVGFSGDGIKLVDGEPIGAPLVPVEGSKDLAGADDRRHPDDDAVDVASPRDEPHPVSAGDSQSAGVVGVDFHPGFGGESVEDGYKAGLGSGMPVLDGPARVEKKWEVAVWGFGA